MKGKITIVLLGLALAFGMIAASCDNGAYPALDEKDASTQFAYDGTTRTDGLPAFTDTDNLKPKIITGDALIVMLEEYVSAPLPGNDNNRVKKYILTKVVADSSELDSAKKELKARYAGMPLIIKNTAAP